MTVIQGEREFTQLLWRVERVAISSVLTPQTAKKTRIAYNDPVGLLKLPLILCLLQNVLRLQEPCCRLNCLKITLKILAIMGSKRDWQKTSAHYASVTSFNYLWKKTCFCDVTVTASNNQCNILTQLSSLWIKDWYLSRCNRYKNKVWQK